MVTKTALVTFILPAAVSLAFGGAVMYGLAYDRDGVSVQSADPGADRSELVIVGLSEEYGRSDTVEIRMMVDDPRFRCGDLYITIGERDGKPEQKSYVQVCAGADGMLGLDPEFSEPAGPPGDYEIKAILVNSNIPNLSADGTFTVK